MWEPPKILPDISSAKEIAVDLETRDPNLLTMGPGAIRNDGYIIGFSMAVDGWSGYIPIRHEGGGNLPVEPTLRWVKDMMATMCPKIGANILYDLEWLRHEGIEVAGPKYDVQIAEPLIDENQFKYSLDVLSERYFNEHKDETLLLKACEEQLGITNPSEAKGNMWRLHSQYVGPYGEKDATLPLRLFTEQRKILLEQDLWGVFELETGLVDLLLDMRYKGIPVNVEKAEMLRDEFLKELDVSYKKLCKIAGCDVDVWSGKNLGKVCTQLDYRFPTTDKGNPSFPAEWLEAQTDPFFSLVAKVRKLDRAGGTFVQSKILDKQVNGRVHPRFRQVRGDDKGTRSGRFASEDPNMQQVPARDKVIAPKIRSLFIPEPGKKWATLDWSQQEPRVTVHYAALRKFKGADIAMQRYIDKPDTDYHQLTADMILEFAGLAVDRSDVAKPMNLGLAYGMGAAKMAAALGFENARDAKPIINAYHKAMPYVKLLGDDCTLVAQDRGYIRTISGRRRRFNLFGPRGWKPGVVPKLYEEAVAEWGSSVVPYFTHKALNALIQGTSADMMKYAMLKLYKDLGEVPHMTIHDELNFSIDNLQQLKNIYEVMLQPLPKPLLVPLKIDVDLGDSWGGAVKIPNIYELKDIGA